MQAKRVSSVLTVLLKGMRLILELGLIIQKEKGMKKILIGILLASFAGLVGADTWVNGYTRSDGTYVQGHNRSPPNSYQFDNYSSQGNYNPYTGEKGSQRSEFSTPSIYDGYGNSRRSGSSW